jgi:hypothetical protein
MRRSGTSVGEAEFHAAGTAEPQSAFNVIAGFDFEAPGG